MKRRGSGHLGGAITDDNQSNKVRHVPPPLVFLSAYAAGEILHHFAPLRLGFVSVPAIYVAGFLLLIGGILIALTSVATFLGARTTPVPYRRAATLVMWGPYRWSRNPMYLGATGIYLGVAALRLALWPVVLLPLALATLNYVVIPQEEALLRNAFGAEYERYCARVRRWL